MPLPAVTVLMASYNSAAYVADALASVLAQTLRTIEVVVVDDASTDSSAAIVSEVAARDGRVRLFRSAVRGGPACARNIGLDQVRGRWIAVMDSDDLIHPERLERLLHAAETHGSDIAADNLLIFHDDPAVPPGAFDSGRQPREVALADYVLANAYGRYRPASGYLKPLFRTGFIRDCGARYQPALQVAQDFSFVRLLLGAGARFHVFPQLTYFYRKHAGSNSHRLSASNIAAMMADDAGFLAQRETTPPALLRAFAARHSGFQRALAFDTLVQALKTRRWAQAATLALRTPRAALQLWQPLANRVGRRVGRETPNPRPQVCMVARAASAPLRELAEWLAAAGADTHLVIVAPDQPRPRAPATPFASIAAQRRASRPDRQPVPPGDWSTATKLFIARHARPVADIIVVEGAEGIAAVPFVLRPSSPVLVIATRMPEQPDLLSRAGAILTEAAWAAALRRACPDTPIILLPGRSPYDGVPLPAALAALLCGHTAASGGIARIEGPRA